MAFFWSLLPILALIFLMTKKEGVPSYQALPLIAILAYLIKLIFFDFPPKLVHAAILNGLLTAWTPVLIVFGAIFLFSIMELTGAMNTIRNWLNHLSANPIAQLIFGDIQLSISQDPNTGLEPTTILALQSVGAAMGNMVCIHNIVAVCSILGIISQEGAILKKTIVPFLIYGVIASITALFL